jgi:hypothetical protein
MKAPEVRLQGTVTASTATVLTFVPSGAKDANAIGATITDLKITGTGLAGFAVGDRLNIRINAM